MSNYVLPNYEFGQPLPRNFGYDPNCPLNEIAFIIPNRTTTPYSTAKAACVDWQQVPSSPSTVKHLYSEIPLNYEQMFNTIPKDTLYGFDFSRNWPTGLGRNKIIGGGHYKTWPLTNEHVLESRDYTSYYFKRPGPILGTGSSYNDVQTQPTRLHTNW